MKPKISVSTKVLVSLTVILSAAVLALAAFLFLKPEKFPSVPNSDEAPSWATRVNVPKSTEQEPTAAAANPAEPENNMQSVLNDAFYNTDFAKSFDSVGTSEMILSNYILWQKKLGLTEIQAGQDVSIVNESIQIQDNLRLYCLQNFVNFHKVHYVEFLFTGKDSEAEALRFESFIAAIEYGTPLQYTFNDKSMKDIFWECARISRLMTHSAQKMVDSKIINEPEAFYTGKYGTYFCSIAADGNLVVTLR